MLRRSVDNYGYFDTPVAVSFAMIREEQYRAAAPTLHDALTPAFLGRVDVALMQVCIISKLIFLFLLFYSNSMVCRQIVA